LKRPYFFELFVVLNLIAVTALAWRSLPILGSPLQTISGLLVSIATQAVAGVAVRGVIALIRSDRGYFRVILSRQWLTDTVRLVAGASLIIFTYGWIKLVVPVYHPRLFDQELWDLDQTLFLGSAPTILFLDLFASPAFLRAIDWSYANIFFVSTVIAMAYFLSEPSRRIRIAFANGYALMWLIGAWLYMLVPSLGPAYRFPDLWLVHGESLRTTQRLQALLMKNYRNVLTFVSGETIGGTSIVLGIGAFPSLHVAAQMYVFLWMRRLWTSGEVIFAIFVIVIFLGSMITGWHYFIDGVAGALLALACYVPVARSAKLSRFLELRRR